MSTQSEIKDTSLDAESIMLDLIRKQLPVKRLSQAFSASRRVAEQCKRAIRRQHPEYSDDEIKLRFIELNYGKELADDVRAWIAAGRPS